MLIERCVRNSSRDGLRLPTVAFCASSVAESIRDEEVVFVFVSVSPFAVRVSRCVFPKQIRRRDRDRVGMNAITASRMSFSLDALADESTRVFAMTR
jgi:hypothetical protein